MAEELAYHVGDTVRFKGDTRPLCGMKVRGLETNDEGRWGYILSGFMFFSGPYFDEELEPLRPEQ